VNRFGVHAETIPDSPEHNMLWRAAALRADPKEQRILRRCCEEDMLFFVKGFCWGVDPRGSMLPSKIEPFIPFPAQVAALESIAQSFGMHDLVVEKSRDMGATYMFVQSDAWALEFMPGFEGLVIARNEDQVDTPGAMASYMEKVRFTLRRLPPWMRSHYAWPKLKIRNLKNDAVLQGSATVSDAGRGDRRTRIMIDEAASIMNLEEMEKATADATDNRVYNSTPKGTANRYYQITKSPSIRKIRLHWSDHPRKRVGLYRATENEVRYLDPANKIPEDELIRDGRLRSIAYDREWRRRGCEHDAEARRAMAQEWDLDYEASDHVYFSTEMINQHVTDHARKPSWVGEIVQTEGHYEGLRRDPAGRVKVWCKLGDDEMPPRDERYVMGIDISFGTGSSNSAIRVWSRNTRELVASYVCPRTTPHRLAEVAYAMGTWFAGNDTTEQAYAIWEAQGPGRTFSARFVEELGYRNFHRGRSEETFEKTKVRRSRRAASEQTYGVHNKDQVMGPIFDAARNNLSAGVCKCRDQWSLEEEYTRFVIVPNKHAPEHASTQSKSVDPTTARMAHGDTVIADVLAIHIVLRDYKKIARAERRAKAEMLQPRSMKYIEEMMREVPSYFPEHDTLGPHWN
jgi:hypothetical protein